MAKRAAKPNAALHGQQGSAGHGGTPRDFIRIRGAANDNRPHLATLLRQPRTWLIAALLLSVAVSLL